MALINEFYIPYLEYGMEVADVMTDDEITKCDQFIKSNPGTYIYGTDKNFTKCEISGFLGNCVEVEIH